LIGDLGLKPSDLLLANGILVVEGSTDKRVYTHMARIIQKPFEEIGLEVIDGEGAGNIPKYLKSPIIQRTCFKQYCLCDSNAEEEMREKLKDVVPDENILALDKGDLEDYYPRDIVMQFIKEHPKLKNGEVKIPSRIEEGETVTELNRLLGVDWWKTSLSRLVIENIKSDQIDDEIVGKISEIYNAFC
jgi:predicted ATP-dependent endonuclease of OLD family